MCLSRDAIKAHVQCHCDGNEVDREFAKDLFRGKKSKSEIITTIVDAQIRPPAIKTIVFSTEYYVSPEQLLCFDQDEDQEEAEAESADDESSQSSEDNSDESEDIADEEEDGVTSLDVVYELARMVRDGENACCLYLLCFDIYVCVTVGCHRTT